MLNGVGADDAEPARGIDLLQYLAAAAQPSQHIIAAIIISSTPGIPRSRGEGV